MNTRHSAVRASVIASLALVLAAPLGMAWAQPDEHHQRDSHAGGSGHPSGPPQGAAPAPRGAGAPTPHPGGGAPNGGHFSVAPRFHGPAARPGNAPVAPAAPAQNFRPAPQAVPQRGGGGPAFRGSRGDSNARGPANGFAGGPDRAHGDSGHFADSGRFAGGNRDAGQGQRGFAPDHDRGRDFHGDRDHRGGLAFARPQERHYDRDHWENHRHWDGGYWNGRYWPAIHDRANFVWLLPALPVGYVTYSWDGVPYYYYNDTYYTWDPGYGGYVATVPPPVDDSGPPPDQDQADVQPDEGAAQPDGQLYAYPTRGQSPEQQAEDRQECQQWASSQSPAADDSYQRALRACLTGRGYSVD